MLDVKAFIAATGEFDVVRAFRRRVDLRSNWWWGWLLKKASKKDVAMVLGAIGHLIVKHGRIVGPNERAISIGRAESGVVLLTTKGRLVDRDNRKEAMLPKMRFVDLLDDVLTSLYLMVEKLEDTIGGDDAITEIRIWIVRVIDALNDLGLYSSLEELYEDS